MDFIREDGEKIFQMPSKVFSCFKYTSWGASDTSRSPCLSHRWWRWTAGLLQAM